ncbi:hypothetical protein EIN_118840, partial [Entamoeba invadens IP1]
MDVSLYDAAMENEGYAFYMIVPNTIMVIEWILLLCISFLQYKRSISCGKTSYIFIVGSMFILLMFVSTELKYTPPNPFVKWINVTFQIIMWTQCVVQILLSFSLLFEKDKLTTLQYKKSVKRRALDADRSYSG